jgi:AcrR family transcriptional regulator
VDTIDPVPDPQPTLGLRERKKQRTRRHIAQVARALFSERGFDAVTVKEIARAAEVAEATVFNHFPRKEDLFYSELEAFELALVTAIRDRPPDRSFLSAFAEFWLGLRGISALNAADEQATARIRSAARLITDSPALLAREREISDRYARTLAAALSEELDAAPHDVLPQVTANALIGLHRALIGHMAELALGGEPAHRIVASVREQAQRAIAQLERGFGELGKTPTG